MKVPKPCIDVLLLNPGPLISTLAIVTCCLIDGQTLALHRLAFFFFPKDLLLPRSLLGPSFKSFSFPGLCYGTGSALEFCTFEHLTCWLAFPHLGAGVRMWPAQSFQPWSIHEPALIQIINSHSPYPVGAQCDGRERRRTSKAINWQPTGRGWPTELFCLHCVLNLD